MCRKIVSDISIIPPLHTKKDFLMYKQVFLLAILAIFFGCKTQQVSYNLTPKEQPKEEWVIIEEGEHKGKYRGKLWGIPAFKFENESDSKYNRYIIEEKNYASNKQAIERCKRLGDRARAEMDKYGSPDVNHNEEGGFVLNPGESPFGPKIPLIVKGNKCSVTIKIKQDSLIQAKITVGNGSKTVRMTATLPF